VRNLAWLIDRSERTAENQSVRDEILRRARTLVPEPPAATRFGA